MTGVERLALRHLRLVVAVIEEGTLVGAARRLNLTQPAVSKALQEIEAQVGEVVFERTNRGMSATPYGEALAMHARLILTQLAHAAAEIADLRDGRGGRLAVGTLLSASAELLPRAIARLRAERPRLAISVVEGANDVLLPQLRSGALDLVVGRLAQGAQREGFTQEVLFEEIACVVARPDHPLVQAEHLDLKDLGAAPWILPSPDTNLRRQVEMAFLAAGAEPPNPAVESVSLVTNQALIQDAGHLAIWPWSLAAREARLGRVAILPVTLAATIAPCGITTRKDGRLSPAARAAIDQIRAIATTLPAAPRGFSTRGRMGR